MKAVKLAGLEPANVFGYFEKLWIAGFYLVAGVLDLITHFVKEKVKIHTANKKAVKAENEKKQAEDARKQAEEAGKKLEEPKGEETV